VKANAGDGAEEPSSIVEQYETLRRAALGQALPPESRCGLLLFLRRGMWGWARALVSPNANVPQPRSYSPSLNFNATNESRAIIHIFAAMAMNADLQGAAP
jgi:hypothetical protein